MLDEPDDTRIRLVAEGLFTVLGPQAAVAELVRLYGRSRARQALQGPRRVTDRPSPPEPREIVIDLVDVRPRTVRPPAVDVRA